VRLFYDLNLKLQFTEENREVIDSLNTIQSVEQQKGLIKELEKIYYSIEPWKKLWITTVVGCNALRNISD
jgi:hypothetical protein